jgi:hypothetical protein
VSDKGLGAADLQRVGSALLGTASEAGRDPFLVSRS